MTPKKSSRRKPALGKGLTALLKDTPFLAAQKAINPGQEIPLQQIQTNPNQPRQDFAAAALQELCTSIQQHGIIQPITVRQLGPSAYQIIAGERRFQAAKLAKLTHIPAYIRTADDQQMLEMALVENIQRADLNPVEIALSYQRLLTECKMPQATLGTRVGKNRATVNNYLRLLKLPPEIQLALRDQKVSMGHARALVNVAKRDAQLKLFQQTLQAGLSVRNVETRVRALAKAKQPKTVAERAGAMQAASAKLATQLKTSVKIHFSTQEKGEIKIAFADNQGLRRLLKVLLTD